MISNTDKGKFASKIKINMKEIGSMEKWMVKGNILGMNKIFMKGNGRMG